MPRQISSQEWEQWKDEVVRLYVEKDYQLKVVREKLVSKGFEARSLFHPVLMSRTNYSMLRASESQYRTRFKTWNVRKPKKRRAGGTGLDDVDATVAGGQPNHGSEPAM